MTKAEKFLDQWISENVHPDAYVAEDGSDTRPSEYAAVCVGQAEEDGISRAELEAVSGNLETYMANAINTVVDREIDRLVDKE